MFHMQKRASTPLVMLVALLIFLLPVLASGCGSSGKGGKASQSQGGTSGTSTPVAEQKKPAYPTHDITYVVPVAPGGGFDTYSRILAPYLEKYLPNKVNIVVKNMPGADFALGINEIYNAKPDGYTIGLMLPGNVFNQVLGRAQYDLNKMTWLGALGNTPSIATVPAKSPYKTIQDLQKAKEIRVALPGGYSTVIGAGSLVAANRLGIKMKFTPTKGSSETVLAALRGDADFVSNAYAATKNALESKELVPLWIFGNERTPELPNVPTIGELGYPELGDIFTNYFILGTAPKVPEDVAKVLSAALEKALADPELGDKFIKAGMKAKYQDSKEVLKLVNNFYKAYVDNKETILKYVDK